MKKLISLLFLLSVACFGQSVSDTRIPQGNGYIPLTTACTNANTTCDTTSTIFGNNGTVLGPYTVEFNTISYGQAVVYLNGNSNASGATISFEFSDDGGIDWYQNVCTRTDANIQEGSEAIPSSTWRAWDCAVGAATRMRIRLTAISSGQANIAATVTGGYLEPAPTVALSNTVGSSDPCQNPGVLKSSVAVSVSSATTTQLVALSAGKSIYVCGGTISSVGGTSTLEYGTGASCGTGTTTLTGAFPAASTVPLGSGLSLLATASGNALCILSGASTTATAGFITYVQQ